MDQKFNKRPNYYGSEDNIRNALVNLFYIITISFIPLNFLIKLLFPDFKALIIFLVTDLTTSFTISISESFTMINYFKA
jgi:hypothetical protein